MKGSRISGLAAGMVVAGLTIRSAHAADATTDSSVQQLQQQVNALQAEVNNLKAQQQPAEANEPQTMQQIIADSDNHSKLLDSSGSFVGGWDPVNYRFFIASDDGNYLLEPGFWTQFRYAASYTTKPDNWDDGFEVRRLKFYFTGNAISKDLTYRIQLENTDAPSSTAIGGLMYIEYAWAQLIFAHHVLGGDLGVQAGLIKNPVFHEEQAVSDNSILMADRSLADNLVGGNGLLGPFVQGVNLEYTGNSNPLHTQLLFTGGDGSGDTNYTDVTAAAPVVVGTPQTVNDQKFGGAIRGDYKFFGDWADNTDFTGKNSGKHDFLAAGAGLDFSQGDTAVTSVSSLTAGTPPTVKTATVHNGNNTLRWDVDATYLMAGRFIVYGAFVGDYVDYRGTVSTPRHRLDEGEQIQLGYFLCPALQLTARYSISETDPSFTATGFSQSTYNEIGVGFNYFLGNDGSAGNHAKFVFNVDYLPNGTPAVTGLDYQSEASSHGETVFVSQFQLWL
jgi:hypothetical protein